MIVTILIATIKVESVELILVRTTTNINDMNNNCDSICNNNQSGNKN